MHCSSSDNQMLIKKPKLLVQLCKFLSTLTVWSLVQRRFASAKFFIVIFIHFLILFESFSLSVSACFLNMLTLNMCVFCRLGSKSISVIVIRTGYIKHAVANTVAVFLPSLWKHRSSPQVHGFPSVPNKCKLKIKLLTFENLHFFLLCKKRCFLLIKYSVLLLLLFVYLFVCFGGELQCLSLSGCLIHKNSARVYQSWK